MTDDIASRLARNSIPEPNSGCLLWEGAVNSHGYGTMKVRGRMIGAHRMAFEMAKGPISEGLHVCHKCDVRSCINPAHLFAGTRDANMADMVSKGRHFHGLRATLLRRREGHRATKITETDVRAIRAAKGIQRDIGAAYGITQSAVSHIKRRKKWAHVEDAA